MNFILSNFTVPRLHYLFYSTVSLLAGTIFQFLGVGIFFKITIPIILISLGFYFGLKKNKTSLILTAMGIFMLVGAGLCFLQQNKTSDFYHATQGGKISIRGYVSSIEKIQNPRFSCRILLDTATLFQGTSATPCATTLALYVTTIPDILVGDEIILKNVIVKPNSGKSFSLYLAKEKIAATLFLNTFDYELIQRPAWSLTRAIFYFKEKIFLALQTKINRETFQLFSSIFLGNRTAVKKQMDFTKEPFKIWGTSHYLARSGLHLVIFAIIWHFLLSLLPISFLLKQLFLIAMILFYALFSWSSVSFERALLMVLIYKMCLLAGRPLHYIHLITLVTAIVIIVNPLQLFFLDFQLSFGLTFALAWFNYIEARKKQIYS